LVLTGIFSSAAFGAPPIDLAVSVSAAPEPVITGSTLTYTAVVTYFDHTPAKYVVLTDTLPEGAGFVSAISSQGTCSQAGGVVTCAIGGMSNNTSTVTVSIVVTAPSSAGLLSNTVSVVSDTFDVDPGNNQTTLSTAVRLPLLTVVVSGDGTVLGSSDIGGFPVDINCSGGTCSAGYPLGSTVTLSAVPPWFATLTWTGCQESGGHACSLLLDADTTVTADFTPNNNVRLNRSQQLYPRIMDAYAALGTSGSGIIQAQAISFLEQPVFDKPLDVVLEGGMDPAFGAAPGYSVVGPVRIAAGKVAFRRILIR